MSGAAFGLAPRNPFGIPAGVRIPGVKGGTVATEALSTVEGAFDRLDSPKFFSSEFKRNARIWIIGDVREQFNAPDGLYGVKLIGAASGRPRHSTSAPLNSRLVLVTGIFTLTFRPQDAISCACASPTASPASRAASVSLGSPISTSMVGAKTVVAATRRASR